MKVFVFTVEFQDASSFPLETRVFRTREGMVEALSWFLDNVGADEWVLDPRSPAWTLRHIREEALIGDIGPGGNNHFYLTGDMVPEEYDRRSLGLAVYFGEEELED